MLIKYMNICKAIVQEGPNNGKGCGIDMITLSENTIYYRIADLVI